MRRWFAFKANPRGFGGVLAYQGGNRRGLRHYFALEDKESRCGSGTMLRFNDDIEQALQVLLPPALLRGRAGDNCLLLRRAERSYWRAVPPGLDFIREVICRT